MGFSAMTSPFDIIYITGVAGSGKSTIGKAVAHRLECEFLEGDDFHSEASVAKMRAGHPLNDDDRWPWLDRLGAAARAVAMRDGRVVVSCSALRRAYRDRLADGAGGRAIFVQLMTSPAEIQHRMATREGHFMPTGLMASQLATLERLEADERAMELDAGDPPQICCERILAHLQGASDGAA
jgi:gluconokinase